MALPANHVLVAHWVNTKTKIVTPLPAIHARNPAVPEDIQTFSAPKPTPIAKPVPQADTPPKPASRRTIPAQNVFPVSILPKPVKHRSPRAKTAPAGTTNKNQEQPPAMTFARQGNSVLLDLLRVSNVLVGITKPKPGKRIAIPFARPASSVQPLDLLRVFNA